MNETKLITFLTAIETQSFNRCADVLGTKQSTVSARIGQLESDLGVSLFKRGRSGASLTKAGKQFEIHCRTLLAQWQNAKRDLSLVETNRSELLYVNVQHNLPSSFVLDWVESIFKISPDLSTQIEFSCSEQIVRRMHNGDADIAIVFNPSYHPDLDINKIANVNFLMFSSHASRIADVCNEKYIKLGCTPVFEQLHQKLLPQLSNPKYLVGSNETGVDLLRRYGGTLYLPEETELQVDDQLQLLSVVADAPVISLPVYSVVSSRRKKEAMLDVAIRALGAKA